MHYGTLPCYGVEWHIFYSLMNNFFTRKIALKVLADDNKYNSAVMVWFLEWQNTESYNQQKFKSLQNTVYGGCVIGAVLLHHCFSASLLQSHLLLDLCFISKVLLAIKEFVVENNKIIYKNSFIVN